MKRVRDRGSLPALGCTRLWLLLALAGGLALSGLAAAEDQDPVWIANVELGAERQPLGAASGDALISFGEVFDSPDYQFMLLLGPDWAHAYILDLALSDVLRVPRAAVIDSAGQLLDPPPSAREPAGAFSLDGDGRISFQATGARFRVEPLPPLVGEISLEELSRRQPVYARRAAAYRPDPTAVARLAKVGADFEIVAFFGSWCQLCKHHLPQLLATLAEADNPHLTLRLIGVDESMTEPAEWIANCAVSYTPTFVVRYEGEEVGRIEEEPEVSVEADLAEILLGPAGR